MHDNLESARFETSDIDLAAALAMTFKVLDATPSPSFPNRIIFGFDADDQLLAYVRKYRDKEVLVEPKAYYYQLRDIRSRINDLTDKQTN